MIVISMMTISIEGMVIHMVDVRVDWIGNEDLLVLFPLHFCEKHGEYKESCEEFQDESELRSHDVC